MHGEQTLVGFYLCMAFLRNPTMKKTKLTQGKVTLVDDEDYEWLNQWKWYALWYPNTQSFYAVRKEAKPGGGQRLVLMHRQILGLEFGDKRQGDHIHHNTLDNRKSQLSTVTNQQNQFNRLNTKGYSFNKANGKFKAQIHINGKQKYLGLYNTAKEARIVYLKAKEKYHDMLETKESYYKKEQKLVKWRHKPLF